MDSNDMPLFADSSIEYQIMRDILHANYLKKKHPILKGVNQKDETESIWFDIDKIRPFLENILGDERVTGIRVYLCSYSDSVISEGTTKIPHKDSFVKQLTIGLVATRKVDGSQIDYHTSPTRKSLIIAPPQNHGELCPTSCV